LSLKEESMSGKKYSREFEEEVVRQVIERGYSVKDVAPRIGAAADAAPVDADGGRSGGCR
jgi:transposase-like protein